ncbi:alpha/beta fold hydrolase [Methylomagnum sp.]
MQEGIIERYVPIKLPPREFSTQYLTAGNDDGGTPLLLLHGLADSAYSWRWVIPALAATHRVYAPSLPGFGRSAKPKCNYSPEFFTAFVASFMQAVGLERAAVVGNSLGGLIAMRLALAEPERVSALALLDSAGLGRQISWALRLMTLPGLGPLLVHWHRTPPGARLWAASLVALLAEHPKQLPAEWREELYEMARSPGYLEATIATARSGVSLKGQRDGEIILDRLKALTVPVLVLWGACDRIVPVGQTQALSQRLADSRTVVLADCGHVPQIEQPGRVGRLLAEFFGDGLAAQAAKPLHAAS